MNFENNIKDIINQKLEDGTIEKLVAEQFEKGITNALDNLFRSYGDVTQVIEKQVKSVMIPHLENYDYGEYITKLDSVLIEVLQSSALDNRKLLTNFKTLMSEENSKEIKVTELFGKWKDYVSKCVETYGLDIDYDDEPTYEHVEVNFDIEYNEERSWLKREDAIIIFECDHDEGMNMAIPIYRYADMRESWSIDYKTPNDIRSLRLLSEFEVFLMKLNQTHSKVIIDSDGDWDEVLPEERPEASFY